MISLNWWNVTGPYDSKYLVKGTILNKAIIPGTMSRFCVGEIRTLVENPNREFSEERYFSDICYALFDAETVTLKEVRDGKNPKEIFRANTIEEIISEAHRLLNLSN